MAVMAIPTVMIPVVMIPIDWRHIVLVGGDRSTKRRNRRGLRGPRDGQHQQCCHRHRKTVRVIFILLFFSSGANLCDRITRKQDDGSATIPISL